MNIKVNKQSICMDCDTLVSTTQGIYKCKFTFDSSWDGFIKVAVFIRGNKNVEIALDDNNECAFADELIQTTGTLYLGVYGVKDNQRYPTIKSKLVVIKEGVTEGVEPIEPTEQLWEQLLNRVAELDQTKQDKLIAGKNITIIGNVISSTGGGGGGSSDYNDLENKPKVNGVELVGDVNLKDLSVYSIDEVDTELDKKVEKVNDKGLSTNDFTNEDKSKLDSLENYDDTEIREELSSRLSTDLSNIDSTGENKIKSLAPVKDVTINNASIVVDGVVNMPIGKHNVAGVLGVSSNYGMQTTGVNIAPLNWATYVDNRQDAFASYKQLDYAVKKALCDGKGQAYTEEEQRQAQIRLGIISSEGVLF